jgi:hypothetical protein
MKFFVKNITLATSSPGVASESRIDDAAEDRLKSEHILLCNFIMAGRLTAQC